MATTTHYGWGYPVAGDSRATGETELTATVPAIDSALWGVQQQVTAHSEIFGVVFINTGDVALRNDGATITKRY